MVIQVSDGVELDESEINYKFIRSPGPGGQHVNRAATGVQLYFDVKQSPGLPERVRRNLYRIAGNRINSKGILIISASRFRSQDLNRKDALERLIDLIEKSSRRTKPRRRTKPTASSVRKRVEAKKKRSRLKQTRQKISGVEG